MGAGDLYTGIRSVEIAPTVDTNAYAAEDLIGDVIEIAAGQISRLNKAILQGVNVWDDADQGVALALLLFRREPSNTTFTDQAALAIHSSDRDALIGVVPVAAADYVALNAQKVAYIGNLFIPIDLAGGHSLWVAVVSAGTPTYGAATDLRFTLNFTGG